MSAPATHAARSTDQVRAYYARKTEDILRKYGPGPRVHFHTGLVDAGALTAAQAAVGDGETLRSLLVASQERLLDECAHAWGARDTLRGDVLDVGCGLGGGAIYWAQEHAAQVTALTDVPAHVPWIRKFSLNAGVSGRVRPTVADAHGLEGPHRFDAAVAIESSCYFDRAAWFGAVHRTLRPDGRIFVVDSFRNDPLETDVFDAYWMCRLGTLAEYERAAMEHGFELVATEDLTSRIAGFWEISRRFTEARHEASADADERHRLECSASSHRRFQRAYESRSIAARALVFERRRG